MGMTMSQRALFNIGTTKKLWLSFKIRFFN